jgi:hypothetical protein
LSDGVGSGQFRPKFYEEVNNTLTASTDVVTQFGTVRICWHDETVINVVLGEYDPGERRTSVRRFLPPHPEGQQLIARFMRYFMGKSTSTALCGRRSGRFPSARTRPTEPWRCASVCR